MTPISGAFELRRPLIRTYAAVTLVFASTLLLLALRRGPMELAFWFAAYLGLGLLSTRWPRQAPLVAGFLAFVLGFVRTYRHGYNLDLGLGLITLALGLYWLDRSRRELRGPVIDIGGLSLLVIAAWSLVSMAFAIIRIRSFAPAPGFAYHVYRFNPLGLSSEEAVVRVVLGAAGVFVWFGLYEFARSVEPKRRSFGVAVFLAFLVNSAALVVQRNFAADFLHPVGMPATDRLNGVTSFCYALGDVTLVLFLLLPVWGSSRALRGVLTVTSLALLTHAVVASGSRSALLTIVLASVLWAGVRLARLSEARRRLAGALSLTTAVVFLATAWTAYHVTPPDQATPLGRLKEGIERQGLLGHLYATRLSTYPLIFEVLERYPLSGVGVGLYPAEVDRQRALLTPNLEITDRFLVSSNAPNQFLNTGVELGLPAMLALVVVFVRAGWSAWARSRGARPGDDAVCLVALALALQFGPTLLNSEALVFVWLVVGRAARWGLGDAESAEAPAGATVRVRRTTTLLVAAVVLGVGGQLLAVPSLAVDRQWRLLRWPLNIGLKPKETGGRWTNPEATFVVDTSAPRLVVRWHTGDQAAPDYRGEVSFYVDGVLVERSLALSGRIRQSVLVLPTVQGLKRISVRVSPAFVPALALGGGDRRELGVFIHSASPATGDMGTSQKPVAPSGKTKPRGA